MSKPKIGLGSSYFGKLSGRDAFNVRDATSSKRAVKGGFADWWFPFIEANMRVLDWTPFEIAHLAFDAGFAAASEEPVKT